MKNTTNKLVVLPLMAIALLPALSHAQDLSVGVKADIKVDGMTRGGPDNGDGRMYRGSDDKSNSKGDVKDKDWNHSSTTKPDMKNTYAGTVTAVTANSFTVSSHDRNGTTTTVISVDANTSFRANNATTTLANLAVGQKVVVSQNDSTTAGTIVAGKVTVLPAEANVGNNNGNGKPSFWTKWFGWFKKIF